MFEPAKNFLSIATQKYKLGSQALGALVCTKFTQLVAQDYPDFVSHWEPQHFVKGVLSVKADKSAASSALFLRTHDILEKLSAENLPQAIIEIKIVR